MADLPQEEENVQEVEKTSIPTAEESVAEAFKVVEEKQVEKPAEKVPEGETAEQKEARERDEKGRFAKKTEAKETPATAKEAQPAVTSPEQKAALPIPEGLSPQFKARWNELNPEWQQEISRREEAARQGFSRMDEERHYGRSIKEVVTPYMPMLAAEGATPHTAIQSLLNTAYVLRTGTPQAKEQLFVNLAKQFGVNIANLPNVMQQPNPQPTPQIDVRSEVRRELTAFQQQQEEAQAKATIAAFAADPKNVHYESVKYDMAALLQAGRARDMQDAYDRACYANPEVRATLESAKRVEDEAKRAADIKAKADAAKKAAPSVVGSPSRFNGKAPANPTQSPFDSVRDAFNAIEGGRM